MKRSDGESRVNHQPLQYCIQSQEEEIQPEGMNVEDQAIKVNLEIGDRNQGLPIIHEAQKLSSVGIVGRLGTTKISARVHRKIKKQMQKQISLLPWKEMMR